MHQPCEHTNFGTAEHFPGELGRAVGPGQPAQVATLLPAGAVGPLFGSLCKAHPAVVCTTQVNQHCLCAQAQLFHIHSGRHGKKHMAQLCTLAMGVRGRMGLMVATARLFGRLWNGQLPLQQLLDGGGSRSAGGTVGTRHVI